MTRPIDPLSKRSRNRTFTGAQISEALDRKSPARRPIVRKASEFDLARLITAMTAPRNSNGIYAWSLEQIRAARDAQLQGKFELPAKMAESMRTDDALFTAYGYRLAPQRAISVELRPAKHPMGVRAANEAEPIFGPKGNGVTPDTLADVNGQLANHGVAFAYNVTTPREDGSRVDLKVHAWPIEWVEWDPIARCFVTRIEKASTEETAAAAAHLRTTTSRTDRIPIVHGDGRWIVFRKHELDPWKQDAALLPAAMVWARHAFAARDWAKGSASHGNAKVVGELPEGVSLQATDADGNVGMTSEAAAFLMLLQDIASQDQPVGIRPAGSKTDYVTNGSGAWQVWERLMGNAEKSSARIYLGTDGILGASGGAPGVDITKLFGVATTIVQGDLAAIERGLREGAIEVWTAINFGDSAAAPAREYLIPDADEEAIRESFAKRNNALLVDMKSAKDAGCVVDQEYVDILAERHGVPAPRLAIVVNMASTDPNTPAPVSDVSEPALPISAADPDGDGEPGEPPSDESAQKLADDMTAGGIDRCEHNSRNRCRLCGIERVRDFERDENGQPKRDEDGNVIWKVAWRPIPRQ